MEPNLNADAVRAPRDVMAERFDKMRGALRSYDVADAFLTALDDAGFVVVADRCKTCGDFTDLWCHNHGPLKDDGTQFDGPGGAGTMEP